MEKIKSKGYAMFSKDGPFKPYEFERHEVGDNDILIKIMYAGICHSDIHQARSEWNEKENYPMVPGHEIVGQVTQVGKNVTKFKVGDYAGVGCMVNACKDPNCDTCHRNREQECHDVVFTYASPDKFHGGEITQGGYSNNIVISEDFAIQVPKTADMEKLHRCFVRESRPIHRFNFQEFVKVIRSQLQDSADLDIWWFNIS